MYLFLTVVGLRCCMDSSLVKESVLQMLLQTEYNRNSLFSQSASKPASMYNHILQGIRCDPEVIKEIWSGPLKKRRQ